MIFYFLKDDARHFRLFVAIFYFVSIIISITLDFKFAIPKLDDGVGAS